MKRLLCYLFIFVGLLAFAGNAHCETSEKQKPVVVVVAPDPFFEGWFIAYFMRSRYARST